MSDKIVIQRLKVETIVGVNENERFNKQHIFLTVTLYTSFDLCGQTDDITHTTNYAWVADELTQLVQNLKAKTIEFLGVSICNWLLSSCDASIEKVKVQIDKPAAIKEANNATVVVKRSRNCSSPSSSQPSSSTQKSIQPTPSSSSHQSCLPATSNIYEKCGLDFCGFPLLPLPSKSTKPTRPVTELCYIALGTNLGLRSRNIANAISELRRVGNIRHISFLYETPAAYVTDQPAFLNCVVSIDTSLDPQHLLSELKAIEAKMGRKATIRFGPRIIDLDIVWMGQNVVVNQPELIIPHASMHERAFVMVPLLDICPKEQIHPILKKSLVDIYSELPQHDISNVQKVIPFPLNEEAEVCVLVDENASTKLMGILNATPDSFTDGGLHQNVKVVEETVSKWLSLPKWENMIIDIGGETTKPFSIAVDSQEEIERLKPVIDTVSKLVNSMGLSTRVLISVDTKKLEVFEKAYSLGCRLLNDVGAAARFYSDRKAHEELAGRVRDLQVPWVLMHSRGKPENMNQLAHYEQGRVAQSIASEMLPVIKSALEIGVLPWQIIVDPGIGFAKMGNQNIEILKNLSVLKGYLGHFPLLAGLSRKRFLGTMTGNDQEDPKNRDAALLALIPKMIESGANILRVHDLTSSHKAVVAYEHVYRDIKL